MTLLRFPFPGPPDVAPREWRFAVRKTLDDDASLPFIAWCAQKEDLGSGPLDIDESFEVHFEFGETAADALGRLKSKVLS